MNDQMLYLLKDLQPDELNVIKSVTVEMSQEHQQQFLTLYRQRRKEEQTILLLTLIGFFGFAGIQRFVIGEIGMGIVFFLTAGFCGIGTIIDIINHKKMTFEFNQKQAYECAAMVNVMNRQ